MRDLFRTCSYISAGQKLELKCHHITSDEVKAGTPEAYAKDVISEMFGPDSGFAPQKISGSFCLCQGDGCNSDLSHVPKHIEDSATKTSIFWGTVLLFVFHLL